MILAACTWQLRWAIGSKNLPTPQRSVLTNIKKYEKV